MAAGGLRTVLLSVSAWRAGPGGARDSVQLSVTSESAGDFRLLLRSPARGSPQQVVGDFRLSDVSYEQIDVRSHRLTVPEELDTSVILSFDDEREAQKWWTVVSSSLRESRKAAQSQQSLSGISPLVCPKPRNGDNISRPISLEAEPSSAPDGQSTKEELAARLSKCIESGDQTLASKYAAELARQRAGVQIQLKPTNCPKNEINMKVGVEDAKGSVTISTYVFPHTTIAVLKQQIFRDYQFHPSIQRWIIGQCLCWDERTVGSYGIRKDGDTAFLYLLGAKHTKLTPQEQHATGSYTLPPHLPPPGPDDLRRANTLPNRPIPRPVVNNSRPEIMDISAHLNPSHAAPPSPVQIGWACPTCTFINVPTRPGCEMCSMERPLDYIVPEGYKPDDAEQRRLQQENDGLQQYKKEKGRREEATASQHKPKDSSLDDFIFISA